MYINRNGEPFMKKKIFKIAAVLMSAVAICTVFSISIITHSQGDDPLVTLSYLTEIILPQMKQDIMAEVEKLGIKIESDVVTDMPEENLKNLLISAAQ